MGTDRTIFFSPSQLSEILKFGLDKLLSSEGSSMDEVDLESILGETEDGQWACDAPPAAGGGSAELEEASEWGEGGDTAPWARPEPECGQGRGEDGAVPHAAPWGSCAPPSPRLLPGSLLD